MSDTTRTTPIRITVWKESGKYYTHDDVAVPANFQTWEERFRRFIWEHRGAICSGGFITVQDLDLQSPESGFHTVLLRTDDLTREFNPPAL